MPTRSGCRTSEQCRLQPEPHFRASLPRRQEKFPSLRAIETIWLSKQLPGGGTAAPRHLIWAVEQSKGSRGETHRSLRLRLRIAGFRFGGTWSGLGSIRILALPALAQLLTGARQDRPDTVDGDV
jgi:hypothetical protein